MDLGYWAYVAACLLLPAAWGAASACLFSRLDRRRARRQREGAAPIDYMI